MAYSDITARLKADMAAATAVGSIYEYKRLVRTFKDIQELYVRGNEILTDTSFDDNSKWSGDWTVDSSRAIVTGDGSQHTLSQANADFENPVATGDYLMMWTVGSNTLDDVSGRIDGFCGSTDLDFDATDEVQTVAITVTNASLGVNVRLLNTATSGVIQLNDISFKRTGKVHFWEISRTTDDDPTDYNTLVLNKDIYNIDGFYSLDDSAESEVTFQTEIDSIVEALNGDRTLNDLGYIWRPVRKPEIEEEMKVGILCHHARIEVPVMTAQDLT